MKTKNKLRRLGIAVYWAFFYCSILLSFGMLISGIFLYGKIPLSAWITNDILLIVFLNLIVNFMFNRK